MILYLLHQEALMCIGNIRYFHAGGRGHLDVQPHWVTALAFPQHKGLMEGCMGITTDTLLVGRLDGSVAMIDVIDSSSFRRSEIQHCSRTGGKTMDIHNVRYQCSK